MSPCKLFQILNAYIRRSVIKEIKCYIDSTQSDDLFVSTFSNEVSRSFLPSAFGDLPASISTAHSLLLHDAYWFDFVKNLLLVLTCGTCHLMSVICGGVREIKGEGKHWRNSALCFGRICVSFHALLCLWNTSLYTCNTKC